MDLDLSQVQKGISSAQAQVSTVYVRSDGCSCEAMYILAKCSSTQAFWEITVQHVSISLWLYFWLTGSAQQCEDYAVCRDCITNPQCFWCSDEVLHIKCNVEYAVCITV